MSTAKPTNPPSTPMPSTPPLDLGRYVTLRPRVDGTHRVFFQVPARLRPSDWPSLIPLPREGDRIGDLRDAAEVGRIQADARALYADLDAGRRGEAKPEGRTFAVLIRRYQQSQGWADLRPKTQKTYGSYLKHLQRWADMRRPSPMPSSIRRPDVDRLLDLFKAAPVTKKHVRKQLSILMEFARTLDWRTDNPCDGIKIRTPKSKVGIWEREDVEAYVAVAEARGRPSIALMILLEWEIGQRLTDVRGFRLGGEYDAARGVFAFAQSKTGADVAIPVSDRLRALLAVAAGNQLFLFRDEKTGQPWDEQRLSIAFSYVRNDVVKAGGRALLLRWLRHSCIVQLARSKCTAPQIANITGHSLASVTTILSHYLTRDSAMAHEAQAMRGLVERA